MTAPRRLAFRPSPFLRDVMLSGLTAVTVMGSLVVVTGWLASGLGPTLFGAYALSRRLLSAVTSFSTVPVGMALARALAITEDERDRVAYVSAGSLLVLLPNLALLALALLAPGFWARLLLTDASYGPVLSATMVLVVATALYTVVLARYRGTQRIGRANLWQLWTLAIGPALVALPLATSGRVDLIVGLTALATLAAAIPVGRWTARAVALRLGWHEVRGRLRDLMRYSVPRVPGGVAFGTLLAVGPFLAPYFGDLRQAGFLVAGQSILRVVEGGTSAFSLVALPKLASLQARQEHRFLRDRVEDMISMVLHLGLFATVHLVIWSDEIATVWLGRNYLEAVPIIRILELGVLPYLAYAMLRAVIDGLDERAVNTHNMYAACAVTVVFSLALGFGGLGAPGLALAGVAGFLVLGTLTVRHLWATFRPEGRHLAAGAAFGLNLLAGTAVYGIREVLSARLGTQALLAAGIGTSVIGFLGYLAVLRGLRVRWMVEIEQRLRPREGRP